jgi:hypothetical protein
MNKLQIGALIAMATIGAGSGDACAQGLRREERMAARDARQQERFNSGAYGGYGYGVYAPAEGYGPPGFYAPRAGAAPPRAPYGEDLVYHGRERAVLGITLGMSPDGFVDIRRVTTNSPADFAGLRPGDEILAIDGRQVRSYRDVTRMVANRLPNDVIEIEIGRRGRVRQVEAVLAAARPVYGQEPITELGPDGFPSNRQIYRRYYDDSPRQARRARDADWYNGPFAY